MALTRTLLTYLLTYLVVVVVVVLVVAVAAAAAAAVVVVVKSVSCGAQICPLASILALKVKGQGRRRPLFILFIEPTKVHYHVTLYQSLASRFQVITQIIYSKIRK